MAKACVKIGKEAYSSANKSKGHKKSPPKAGLRVVESGSLSSEDDAHEAHEAGLR